MHPLAEKLDTLRRRLLWRERVVAGCWTAATVLAAALVLGTIDYWVRLADPGLRIMATLALAAAAVWALYRWWYPPSRHRAGPLAVARKVESHFPQLRDSLASAVEFLHQSEDDRAAGSPQLRRVVVIEAQTAVEGLPLEEVIDRRPLRRAAGWLAAAAALVIVCLAWDARAVGTAAMRLVAPVGSTEWPREHHLAFREVPKRIAAGQTFEVELVDTAGPLPEDVRIEYREAGKGGSQSTSELMTPAGDVMIARRENVRQSFAFRAEGGDDDTMRWHWVEVVEPPQLESLEITVHPPEYTGLPAAPAERHLELLAGTSIEVAGTTSEPLSAARILLKKDEAIAADVDSDKSDGWKSAFHIRSGQWIAEKSGTYQIELTDGEGVAGVVGQWNLRVEPDSPPSVSWQRPTGDLYVTATAVVPIELFVKDNLAIQRVDLAYERSDRSESERTDQPGEAPIELYRGPAEPPTVSSDGANRRGDSRVVEYAWDLTPLKLRPGGELTLQAEATDYRPGTGRAIGPRRITIITADELEGRLADGQAQIVRQLERALAGQQATREHVRRLTIQQRDAGGLTRADRNTLETAEINQRRVERTLVDPAEGVPPMVDALLAEMEMNRIPSTELRAAMENVMAELQRLSRESLSMADRELTAARKTVQGAAHPVDDGDGEKPLSLPSAQAEQFSSSLSVAAAAQEDVIQSLEHLIAELSGRADYRRLTQQLAELRLDQIAHEKAARADIGLETLPLRPEELTPAQRAELHKAAAGQNALAARFEKLQQAMDGLAQQLADDQSDDAGKLAEAVDLARRLAIGGDMRETSRDLAENRVGQALARETQTAAKLQQVLDVLRNQAPRQPEQLAANLRQAEQRLAALRQQLAALRAQIARAENQPAAADPQQLEQLSKQQQQLQRDIAQLARELERLQAADASQSAKKAADRLATRSPNQSHQTTVQQSEQDLEEAARQLAQRRQQAEDDLALEFVRRFQAELGDMVQRQQRVVDDTVALDRQRPSNQPLGAEQAEAVSQLAEEERELADMARQHGELLFGLGAVRIGLEDAERRLKDAAQHLENRDTGRPAQQAERHALARLEGMLQAFAQTAREAAPQNQSPTAGEQAGEPPQRRPTFELLEVKMLRMLQADLHERTRQFEDRLASLAQPVNERQRVELTREARELKAEQGRLAELVQEMLTRDNEEGGE